jgi:low-density lipoprotein receptor-related protein 1 (alpha-2-macroglobulin receptor)
MHLNNSDSTLCTEDHPCDQWGTCSQLCKSVSRKKHKCYCHKDYYLEVDGFTCKSKDKTPAYAIYSTRNELRSVDVRSSIMRPLISSLKNTIALDFYHTRETEFIFWTDVVDDKIYRGTLIGGNSITDIQAIIENGLSTAEGLAVDWIGENLYWVESKLDQIEVAKLDGRHRRTLIADGIASPRAIAVDPLEGLLFWTDWDKNTPRIESCDMSGDPATRKVVFDVNSYKNGAWPNGLTLDYGAKRLYWIDARADSIHSAAYDGTDHREILRGSDYLSHPFAITLFESYIYWTDWRTTSIVKANKWNGSDIHIIDQVLSQPCDIRIVHPSRQPSIVDANDSKLNCKKNNGNCSHLCLIAQDGFRCACPHLMKLAPDGKSCIANNKVLLLSRPNEIRGLDLVSKDYVTPPLALKNTNYPMAIDFNSKSQQVYWMDPETPRIMRSFINGTRVETVIDRIIVSNAEHLSEAFAIDWITGNIYFATQVTEVLDDMSDHTSNIFVTSANVEFIQTIVHKNPKIIKGLVLAPTLGLMYWHDEGTTVESLNMANMDGSEPEEFYVFNKNVKPDIHCLTYSDETHQLFWINKHDNLIQKWDFKESRLTDVSPMLMTILTSLGSLTIDKSTLLFSETLENKSSIYRMELDSAVFLVANVSKEIYSLRVYDPELQQGSNPCLQDNGGCAHLCLPRGLNHRCICSIGFVLEDGSNCKEDNKDHVLYTSSFGISTLVGNEPMESRLFRPLLTSEDARSIEVYTHQQVLFWLDSKGSLFRMKRDGTEKKVIISGLQSPQRLAVDWVSERIYWTDDKVGVIELANFDGQQRYVVISGKMIKPFAIVLNPLDGILFWSDLDVPKIERAGLDGSNRMIIVTKDLKSPTGLAVDLKLRRLFWCDSEQSSLVSVNFDGGDRKSILESISSKWLSKPFGVAFFEGYLYWIDVTFNGGSVSKISTKTEGRHLPDLLEDNLVSSSGLYDIKIYSSRGQRGTNPCAINNGGCEEICLFNGQRTSCACSHGKIDSNDGKTCVEHDAFILYSKISRLESIHISNASDLNPPIKAIESDEHMRNTIGLAYNYESKLIFYSDIQKGTINQVNFNGENHKVLLSNLGAVEGLVFEHRHKYLYWTCNADTSISRISLNDQNTTNKKVKVEKVIRLQPDDKPRGIDVDSCDGKIYFTNWNAKNPSIQRAWFSGYGLETIISTKIRMPNAIAIDAQDRKMYWGDARLDKIELVYLNNMERIVLRKATPQHPFDLAVYDKYLMYTDWVLHAVVRVNKITGEEMTLLRKNIPRPMSLITVTNQSLECEANPCSVLNGGCEDICKVNRKGHAVCECHPGRFLIRQDGKRCSHTVQHCKDNHDFQCSQSLDQSPICIPYNLTCDGVSHCPDNSDEDERYCAVRRCKSGYFQCANNRCVVNEVKCNGKDNCGDFSDEDNCPCAQDDMFQCTKGPCIPGDQRCNSRPDCIDASDEIGCPKTDCSSFIDDEDKKEFVQDKEFVNCNHTTACILPEWICDGTNDCWDNSDEDHCHPDESLNAHTGDFCPVETTFKCDNGRCISISWRCDRENDCQDSVNGKLSSDEENCTFTCREDQFKCLSGDCIPGSWRCDGTPDCDDASDEPISCSSHSCIDNVEFRCNNSGRCIPLAWVCDGDNDCGDDLPGLDEHPDQQCQGQGHCKADEFRCLNNRCISNHFYCDLDNDCGDNSDEPVTCDYHFCPKDYFRCKNSHGCAPYAKLCDGSNDCLDGSDENRTVCDDLKFHKNAALLKSRCQAKDQFGCTNGACVPLSALCNGQDECGDYSDEASCNTNECENPHTCAHVCKDKPIGYECQCNHGFKIRQDDPSMCDDINECQETYPCAQMCLNTPGSYKCACLRGYIPADPNSHSCKANSTEEFKLLFTSRYYIKLANGLGITQTLVKNQTNTVAIDYDWISDCIFWSDVTSRGSSLRKMCNLTKNVSEPPKIEHLATLQNPDGLAVDWVGRNLYWCDKGSDTIEVSDLNGKHRKVLISQGLREPRAIAVDPQSGLLFWSDWGERPHIGRANMDGTGFKIIIETDLGWPNALAIDYATRELFFGDAREDYIAVSDMDGNNIRMILVRGLTPDAHLQHIFALTVFEDYIYWSDWETSTIERCHKYSGKRNKTVLTTIHRPMDLQVNKLGFSTQKAAKTKAIHFQQPFTRVRCISLNFIVDKVLNM